jgi:hypothetical protein
MKPWSVRMLKTAQSTRKGLQLSMTKKRAWTQQYTSSSRSRVGPIATEFENRYRLELFVEMISSALRKFFDRVYSGGSEKLSVLPADSLDPKEISLIDPL